MSFVLALVMVIGMLPIGYARAEETEHTEEQPEQTTSASTTETVPTETAETTAESSETVLTETAEATEEPTETVPMETTEAAVDSTETSEVPETTEAAQTEATETEATEATEVTEATEATETVPPEIGDPVTDAKEAADGATNYTWELDDYGVLTITGSGALTETGWSDYKDEIVKIVIGEGITRIGDSVFYEHSNVEALSLPDTLTYLGYDSFYGCTSLKSVVLPDSVTYLDNDVFEGCSSLTSVVMGTGVTYVDSWVFCECTSMEWIEFRGDAPEFMEDTFYGVTATVYYPASNDSWTEDMLQSYSGDITWVPQYYGDPVSITLATAPAKVMYVVGDEELDLTGLKLRARDAEGNTWTISNLDDIAVTGFNTDTKGRKTVTVEYGAFTVQFYIYVHQGEAWELQPSSGYPESSHNYGNNMDRSWVYCVPGASSMELTFSSQTETEGNYDFIYLYNADGSEIGCYDGASLAGQTIAVAGDTVTIRMTSDISNSYYGFSLDSIYAMAPAHEVSGQGTYTEPTCYVDAYYAKTCAICSAEVREYVEGTASHTYVSGICTECGIPENALDHGVYDDLQWALTEDHCLILQGSGSVPSDGPWAGYKSDIQELEIRDGITVIEGNAFNDYDSLISVTIADSVRTMGDATFYECSNLESIRLPAYITSIPYDTFSENVNLGNVIIPDSVTEIGDYAFNNCRSMTSVVLPAELDYISSCSFSGCSGLTSIRFRGDAPAISSDAFSAVTAVAYYPGANSTWDDSVMDNFGGSIGWQAWYAPVGVELKNPPSKVMYGVGDTSIDLAGIELQAWDAEGNTWTVAEYDGISVAGFDTNTKGRKTVTVAYEGFEVQFQIFVHQSSGLERQPSSGYPESSHDYGNNMDQTWKYTVPGASSLKLTFSSQTETEANYDFIYLYNGAGSEIGCYDGTSLAGQTIIITGDTVTIRMTTDGSVNYYGFSLDSIYADTVAHEASGKSTYTEATCYEDAYFTHTCGICGETFRQQEAGTSGHRYVGGYCKLCGLPENALDSGTVGSITWVLSDTYHLFLLGSGGLYYEDTAPWAEYQDQITQITVQEGITGIGTGFYGYYSLRQVNLSGTVTSIGSESFAYCYNLEKMTIPAGIGYIASDAFNGCSQLTVTYGGTVAQWIALYEGERIPVICTDGDIYDYGFFGETGSWVLDTKDRLTIFGEGSVPQLDLSETTRNRVASIQVGAGFTELSSYAFSEMVNLQEVELPDGLECIGSWAFNNCVSLWKIEFPDTLTEIGEWAFNNCRSLTTVTLPASVTYLGDDIFESCVSLKWIWLQGSRPEMQTTFEGTSNSYVVKYPAYDETWEGIYTEDGTAYWMAVDANGNPVAETGLGGTCGVSVFWELNNDGVLRIWGKGPMKESCSDVFPWYHYRGLITSLVVEEGVTTICNLAFQNCGNLQTAELPDSLVSIGDGAFEYCYSLYEVNLPAELQSLGTYAFGSCDSLVWMEIPAGIAVINNSLFNDCDNLNQVILPDNLSTIESYAFANCYSLWDVVIPAGVTYIGSYIFENVELGTIWFQGDAPSFSGSAFSGTTATAYYPAGNPSWEEACQNYGGTITWEPYGTGISDSCGDSLYWYLEEDGTLTIQGSGDMYDYSRSSPAPWYAYRDQIRAVIVTGASSIGNYAFYDCSSIEQVKIWDGVYSIGSYAFGNCSLTLDLTDLWSLESISSSAFSSATVTVEYNNVDRDWSSLEKRNYGGTATWKPVYCRGTCGPNLTWVLDFDGVLTISGSGPMTGNGGWNCSTLTQVILPEGLTTIATEAFLNCDSLQQIEIPESVRKIGDAAFASCDNLKQITIPKTVRTIAEDAFSECKKLTICYGGTMEAWTELCSVSGRPVTCQDGTLIASGMWGEYLRWMQSADGVLRVIGFGEMNRDLFSGDGNALTSATELILPEGLTAIYGENFSNLQNVKQITIPAGVTYLDGQYLCSDLWFEGSAPETGGELLSYKIDGSFIVAYYPAEDPSWTEEARAAFGSDVLFVPVSSNSDGAVTAIGSGSCGGNVTWTMWSDGTLSIQGTGAMEEYEYEERPWPPYARMALIKRIVIGHGVTTVSDNAFDSLYGTLDSIQIADTVTSIGEYAFASLQVRDTVEIPSSVTYIGEDAFYYFYGSLHFKGKPPMVDGRILGESSTVVLYPANDPAWTEEVRQDMGDEYVCWMAAENGKMETITGTCGDGLTWKLEDTVLTISGTGSEWYQEEDWDFRLYDTKITEIILEEGITVVPNSVFSYFYNLRKVTLPRSIEEIQASAFLECSALEEVILQEGLKTIGESAFDGCRSLKKISLPESLETIGNLAFGYCYALTDILIPAGVTYLGSYVFSGSGVRVIRFAGDMPEYGDLTNGAYAMCLYDRDNTTWTSFNGSTAWIGVPMIWEVVSIQAEKDRMTSGEELLLTANMSMGIYEPEDVIWSASEFDDARVDLTDNGLEAILSASVDSEVGSVLISAQTPNSAKGADCRIQILPVATDMVITDEYGNELGKTVLFDIESTQEKIFKVALKPEGAEAVPEWSTTADCEHISVENGCLKITACEHLSGEMTVTARVGNLSKQLTLKVVTLGMEREEIDGEDAPDMQLFAGKTKTLKVYDTNTGKALSSKQVKWYLPEEYMAYASINAAGKLTAKKVLRQVRIEVYAIIVESPEVYFRHIVDIYPMTTKVEILSDGELVNGKTLTMNQAAGENLVVTTALYPQDVMDTPVKWTISDKKCAIADYSFEDGGNTVRIIAKGTKAGTVTLKATAQDGSKKSATVKVKVGVMAEDIQIVAPAELLAGKSAKLKATLYPSNVANKKVTWSLIDPEDAAYVKLAANGSLKALKIMEEAVVTIKAEAQDGSGVCGYVNVRIVPQNPGALVLKYNGGVVNGGTILVERQNPVIRLYAYTSGQNMGRQVSWTTNTGVASAQYGSDGSMVMKLLKDTTITAVTVDGRKATVKVKLSDMPESVDIALSSTKNVVLDEDGTIQIASGKNVSLKGLVQYTSGKTGKKVNWTIVRGSAFAKISSGGKLTANKDLTAAQRVRIRASAKEDSSIYAEIDVIIRPLAQGVEMYGTVGDVNLFTARSGFWFARSNVSANWDITEETEMQLCAEVYPFGSDNAATNAIQNVVWSVSNKRLADFVRDEYGNVVVDEDGCVTLMAGEKTGSVTVTATAADGSGKKVSFKLKLVKSVTELVMDDQVVQGGKTLKLAKLIQINPGDATNKKLVWEITRGKAYATLSSSGVFKAKKVTQERTVEVTVSSQDGGASTVFYVTIMP